MNCYESSKDYGNNVITVLFDGGFKLSDLIKYVDNNHPEWSGIVIDYSGPETFRGFVNSGVVKVK
jgi:hypothetical protein